jgi:lipopolysaccharide export system permease protein
MKKIDKLILKAFAGPFVLTFFVCVFIFLLQYLIKYFPDLIGKGLGIEVFAQLFFYFSINVTPLALPLAILISSLIAYGNLGEHFELTALKSAGISLVRTQVPIFIFAILLCIIAFFISNNIVPKANLKAFSLLYDVKQKKPTLDFKEGTFYNGLPGYSIKVGKKFADEKTMKDVVIYNHTAGRGNVEVILADSAKMSSMMNDRYLVMELFKGNSYSEVFDEKKPSMQQFVRNNFTKSKFIFSLESFDMQRTQEQLFSNHRIMRNVNELHHDADSIKAQIDTIAKQTKNSIQPFYSYLFFKSIDSTKIIEPYVKKIDYEKDPALKTRVLQYATNNARTIKAFLGSQKDRIDFYKTDANNFNIEFYRKFTFSFACLVMFLIGAPLGSIIKKGGLGVPILVSISFFIFYYIFSIVAEKWAKEGLINLALGMWFTNLLFLPIGLFFLRQARNDSRLFETDYFAVIFDKLKQKFIRK